jgi:hypothetical protein
VSAAATAAAGQGAALTRLADNGGGFGPAAAGTFVAETEAMAREGVLGVWPYSVRKDATATQRRLRQAREFVAAKDHLTGEATTPSARGLNALGREAVPAAPSVQFLPLEKPPLTAAQAAAMDMVARELAAVEREEAEALAALSRHTAEHRAAQAELARFAARVAQARKNTKLRRAPPSALAPPPPPPLFQETAKAHARAAAKAQWRAAQESVAMAAAADAHAAAAAQHEAARRTHAEVDASARAARDQASQGARDTAAAAAAAAARRAAAQAQERLDDAAQQSRARQVLVECPGCGAVLELAKLPRHQRDACANRKVPCKNFEYGCPCLVRVRDRARHEDASSLVRPRSCLWFGGPEHAARVALDEQDVAPPWTAEYWVWRPRAPEAAVALVGKALELGALFRGLFAQMADTKFRVDALEQSLVANVSHAPSPSPSTAAAAAPAAAKGLDRAAQLDADAARAAAALQAANATKRAAAVLLAANDEYREVAVRVAAARCAYVDVLAAAGRRLAEADAEVEDAAADAGQGTGHRRTQLQGFQRAGFKPAPTWRTRSFRCSCSTRPTRSPPPPKRPRSRRP